MPTRAITSFCDTMTVNPPPIVAPFPLPPVFTAAATVIDQASRAESAVMFTSPSLTLISPSAPMAAVTLSLLAMTATFSPIPAVAEDTDNAPPMMRALLLDLALIFRSPEVRIMIARSPMEAVVWLFRNNMETEPARASLLSLPLTIVPAAAEA